MRSVRTYLPGSGASEGHPSTQACLIPVPIAAIYASSPLASPTTDNVTSETDPGLGTSCANANPTSGNNTQPARIRPRVMVAPFRRLSPQIVSTYFLYIDFCSHPVRCDKSHTGTPTESCCWK